MLLALSKVFHCCYHERLFRLELIYGDVLFSSPCNIKGELGYPDYT